MAERPAETDTVPAPDLCCSLNSKTNKRISFINETPNYLKLKINPSTSVRGWIVKSSETTEQVRF